MIRALSMSLMHFLWQGAILGAIAAVVLDLLGRREARLRYGVACAFLGLMMAAPLATFAVLSPGAHQLGQAAVSPLRAAKGFLDSSMTSGASDTWIGPVLLVWLCGVVAFGLRAAGGLSLLRVRLSVKASAPDGVLAAAKRIASDLGVAKVAPVFTSARVSVPIVFGILRPIIVLPSSALTGLPAAQLEAILAHELAHIARHDFLVNCFQSVVEVLLFYHPAVWWLSGRIRQEREMCCDEMAAEVCGDRVLYSRALVALEEGRQEFAPAANGGDLKRRIEHLLRQPKDHVPESRAAAGLLAILTCCAVVILSAAPRMFAQSDVDAKEHDRRVSYANERFAGSRPGSESSRGRMYIEKGPPNEIESHPQEQREVWLYRNGEMYEFSGPEYDLQLPAAAFQFPSTGEKRIRIGKSVAQGKRLNAPRPEYPAEAKAARLQGMVVLTVLINKNGNVQDVAVFSGAPVLAEAAAKAVRQWTYQTTLLNGEPVEVVTSVEVSFTLNP